MIEKEKLEMYAKKLMFEMNDEEYTTLQKEFDILLKQLALIDNIPDIDKVKPMNFPFVTYKAQFRKDEVKQELEVDDVLKNASNTYLNQVRVPKVVE